MMLLVNKFFKLCAFLNALVAQWIEHLPPKERVTRSIRVEGTSVFESPKRHHI